METLKWLVRDRRHKNTEFRKNFICFVLRFCVQSFPVENVSESSWTESECSVRWRKVTLDGPMRVIITLKGSWEMNNHQCKRTESSRVLHLADGQAHAINVELISNVGAEQRSKHEWKLFSGHNDNKAHNASRMLSHSIKLFSASSCLSNFHFPLATCHIASIRTKAVRDFRSRYRFLSRFFIIRQIIIAFLSLFLARSAATYLCEHCRISSSFDGILWVGFMQMCRVISSMRISLQFLPLTFHE